MLTLFLLTVLIYHRCFRRYDADPEPELGLPAKRLTFLSGPNRLQGYLCGTGDTLAVLDIISLNAAYLCQPRHNTGAVRISQAALDLETIKIRRIYLVILVYFSA